MAAFEPKTAVAMVVAAGVSVCAYLAASVFAPLVCAPFHYCARLAAAEPAAINNAKIPCVGDRHLSHRRGLSAIASLAVWSFGRVGHFVFADATRYQALYNEVVARRRPVGTTFQCRMALPKGAEVSGAGIFLSRSGQRTALPHAVRAIPKRRHASSVG